MLKFFLKSSLFFIMFAFIFFVASSVLAMTRVSDRVSLSWPGTASNHVISFKTTASIPPGGKIKITPEVNDFTIIAGLDYTDIDLATSSVENGVFIDRELSSSSSSVLDGVLVSAGTTGFIEIILNSSYGIAEGVYVQIEIGTNATYGEVGDRQIVNPMALDSYDIEMEIFNAVNERIKRSTLMIATVEPVEMTGEIIWSRTNGRPAGYLAYGTTQTIMSLATNYEATCKYDIASGTLYADMLYDFDYSGGYFHTHILSGLTNGEHTFYVRCDDGTGMGDGYTKCIYVSATGTPSEITSCVDYVISFSISSTEGDGGGETGEGGGDGGAIGGGGGGGGGGGSGGGLGGGRGQGIGRGTGKFLPYPPLPGTPGVAFSGWAYPGSEVVIMRDGIEQGAITAEGDATFGAFLTEIEQGVYTFGIFSSDLSEKRSSTYSTTFWIDDGTQTIVSGIFLSPTIELRKNTISSGENVEAFGQSAPGGSVEVWLYPQKQEAVSDSEILKQLIETSDDGSWSVFLNTSDLEGGKYLVKAKGMRDGTGDSDFSQVLELSIGGEAVIGGCPGADLNHDGKVNITDFSILLFHWGSDNQCADQNRSGSVDLIDFSIMMYYWTG